MRPATWLIAACLALAFVLPAAAEKETLLLRFPDIHNGTIVFSYDGDLWIVGDKGGTARRTTGHTAGLEWFPKFSPDGSMVAFTGDYDGNENVYVMPAWGGAPRCLTYHPARDRVVEWTPDGQVLISTRRGEPLTWLRRLMTVSTEGGLPVALPMNTGGAASYSPDGRKIAFNRLERDFATWKRYRGGTAQDVWIFDLDAQKTTRVTDDAGNDSFPMWQGESIYFVSERVGRGNLWAHDLGTGKQRQVTFHDEFDVKWPSMGPGQIVYENGGALWVLDVTTEKTRRVPIYVPTDRIAARPKWTFVGDNIAGASISPSGKRVAVEARGELFSVPAEKGPTRNLTDSQGVRERNPCWSPDGKWIAYYSDRSGEMEIYVRSADGRESERRVTEDGAVYRFGLAWSPDSAKLLFVDKNTKLYWLDVDSGRATLIDQSGYDDIDGYDWSPDSAWVVYQKTGRNRFDSVYLYSLDKGQSYPVTDATTDDGDPTFDPDGKYVYFASNREMQPFMDLFDANFILQKAAKIYAVALTKDTPSPFAPESDEETGAAKTDEGDKEKKDEDKAKEKAAKRVEIDIDGIGNRVVAFPIPGGNYHNLIAKNGKLYFISRPDQPLGGTWSKKKEEYKLVAFDFKERKIETVISPVSWYGISADGKKILYGSGKDVGILDSGAKDQKPGEGKLDFGEVRLRLDPAAEWRQMFFETWRLERDFFYDPGMHGLDWEKTRDQYAKLLPHVSNREDMNYLIGELIGELGSSHTYVWGGEREWAPQPSVGLLGADFELDADSGRYRLAGILPPDQWDLDQDAPLAQPGLDVQEGDYLLAINGRQLRAPTNPYQLLENTVGEQTRLTIAKNAAGRGERDIVVVPIGSDYSLRYRRWVNGNRAKVDAATGGRIGYVHLPDMSVNGLQEFSKAFAAQVDKQGLVVDVRFNGGGFVSEMILERLRRELAAMFSARNFGDESYPWQVIHGPMVCMINEYSGSDGDIFPYFFRQYGLGKVVGRRTWGGVVGIRMDKRLVDGGMITMPEFGTYGLSRQWIIENHGVDPDVVVDLLPEDVLAGRDPQLETAIGIALDELAKGNFVKPPRPKGPGEK